MMKLPKKFLCVFLYLVTICCNSDKNEPQITLSDEKITTGGNITLIFYHIPDELFIPYEKDKFLGGRSYLKYIASYIDKKGITHRINPERNLSIDTITISIEDSVTEIYFEEIGLEGKSFLFKTDDTAKITYTQGTPRIEILNRKIKKYDFKLETISQIKQKEMSSFENFFRQVHFPDSNKKLEEEEFIKFLKEESQKNSEVLLNDLKRQKKILDSVYKNGLLSSEVFDYYNLKLHYINLSRMAKLKEILSYSQKAQVEIEQEYILLPSKLQIGREREQITNLREAIYAGDSLLNFKFYQEFLLDNFLPNYIENKTTKFSFNYGNFGGNYYEWEQIFDNIKQSNLFPENVNQFLLYHYMDRIASDLSPEIIWEYYKKLISESKDCTYVNLINYKYDIEKRTKGNMLSLWDSYNSSYYLEEIVQKNVGKVIFINFWASWCQPCIEMIPDFKKLEEQFSRKGVIFITIAFDKDHNKWKSSQSFKSMETSEYNYILRNPYSSKFLKDNKVFYVPRYLIINKSGNIVNPNAPKPNESKLSDILNRYLSE